MVSIIVPVYNAGAYILETMRSVEAQTYTDWELILVDDVSTDDSVAVIEGEIARWDGSDIRLLRQPANAGAAATRNAGIGAARGRYIAFLDADDLWYPDKLERELSYMQQDHLPFVFTAYQFGDENATPTGKACRVPQTLTFRQALTRTIIFTSTVLIDTELVSRDLIRMPNMPSEDTATWWAILRSGVTAYGLDELLVIYRRPRQSLSSNKSKAAARVLWLYRDIAGLGTISAYCHLIGWAFHATMRRLLPDRQ